MKLDKKGKIKLQHGDYRVGNFIFHEEGNHIKGMDISGLVSWRISKDTSVGMMLSMAIKEKHDGWLKGYAASIFSQLCVVPDVPFLVKHAELVNAQTVAHPEYYGKPKPTDDKEADDKILQEEKELHEELENIKSE